MALAPIAALAAIPMRLVRRAPMSQLPMTMKMLNRVGVFPIRRHYYEPLFDTSDLRRDDFKRELPGIDLNVDAQLRLLAQFTDTVPLKDIPLANSDGGGFFLNNGNFESGDCEIWFHVIRHFRPARIIEIGSGHSTRMAQLAINRMMAEDGTYRCEHICIEPYEMPWLEKLGVRVLRQKLEDVDPSLIQTLTANDILFIDSSHIIRPQGEVLQEFLQILPRLASGVIVHVHDIFTPRDYPMAWLEHPRFWNEQYLLEAFLTHNDRWEVLLAVNMLKHDHYDALKAACPHLAPDREPGSFYLRRK
jgi:hypothetical protein